MSSIRIESLDQLKKEAYRDNGDFVDFYIFLAGGLVKSSKRISYRPELSQFLIIHEIDESYEEITESNIGIHSNLIEAISKNCLIKY